MNLDFFWDLYSALVVVLNCKWQSLRQASEIIRSFVAAASRCAFCRASWRTIADVLGEKWLQQWHTWWGWLVAGSDCFLGYFLSGPTLRCFTQLIQSTVIHLCGTDSRENSSLSQYFWGPRCTFAWSQPLSTQPLVLYFWAERTHVGTTSSVKQLFVGLRPLWPVISWSTSRNCKTCKITHSSVHFYRRDSTDYRVSFVLYVNFRTSDVFRLVTQML